jgi:hypothetical protein
MQKPVSLYVNCFERDYVKVLSPGFMAEKAGQFRYPFSKVVVSINNVHNRGHALHLAEEAVRRREIDHFVEVERSLPVALSVCGLNARDLGIVRHYIDFALVAVVSAQPGYLLYCCAEVEMAEPFDWITPALRVLGENTDILVANPVWASDPEGVEREAIRREGHHFVGRGFSDQCFLVDAARLARPVYKYKHPSGSRYPMSDVGDIFEKRVDAYMRNHGLLRLTDPRASYIHRGPEGSGYPTPPLWMRLRRKLQKLFAPDQSPGSTLAKAPQTTQTNS